jgi:dolichol-phosphate mannosyltransferase
LEVIEAGDADLVVGWKQHRRDPLRKRLPSKLFNRVTALVSGVHLDDFNTGFKVGRRAVFADVPLYGELHRFVPVFAHDLGHRVVQRPVNHRPRVAGASKFGYERFLRGLLDLLAALVATRFRRRPGHLFGGLGVAMLALGSLGLLYLFVFSLFSSDPIGTRPLLQASVLVEVLGVQLISIGLLAELVVSRSPREEARLFIADRTDESGW